MIEEVNFISDPTVLHVWSCLHNYDYYDAIFAAERLYAETQCEEGLFLLATSLYRSGRPKQVCRLLRTKGCQAPKCRFLLAQCYLDISLTAESESALLGTPLSHHTIDDIPSLYGDIACYVARLLGDIYRIQGRIDDATTCYKKCLQLNPLMWSAYESICNMGECMPPSEAFKTPSDLVLTTPSCIYIGSSLTTVLDKDGLGNDMRMKSDNDFLFSRENVNPSVLDMATVLASRITSSNEALTDKNHVHLHRKSFFAPCDSTVPNAIEIGSLSKGEEPMEIQQVQSDCPLTSFPHNYSLTHEERFANRDHSISPTCEQNPSFGHLALLPQSPLFACVPVFSKAQDLCNKVSEHNFVPYSQTRLQQITRSFGANSQSTQPRRRSKRTVISSNPSADILDDKITLTTLSKNSLIKQPSMSTIGASASSSTPNSINYTKRLAPEFDHSAGKITCLNSIERHSFHPHTTFAASSTSTPAGSALTEAPATRSDMPRLRSSSFRASNIVENHGTPLTSASQGARKHSSLVSQLGKQVYIPKDSASTPGPRTRSQVAKAAASSRRSSRLLGTHHASLTFVAQNVSNKGHELAKCNDLCVNDLALGHLSNSKNPNPCGLAKSSMLNTSSTALASQVGPTMCCSPVLTESLNGNIKLPPQQWDQEPLKKAISPCLLDANTLELISAHNICRGSSNTSSDPRLASFQAYLDLLVKLGTAYQSLADYRWRDALEALAGGNGQTGPSARQLATGRLLSWAGRAHVDGTEYALARQVFREVRSREPWQLTGMDVYSTALYQLQADADLSQLAHDLLDLDRGAPEPWCAAGNCFARQREHHIAIRFFRRAIKVCPSSAYACTLLGYELSAIEDFPRAISAFCHALRNNFRHYNALWGLANVYYRQERISLAEVHLARACFIFPQSHVLLTHLGVFRGRLGKIENALDCFDKACELQPNNSLAKYHRATILFHLERYQEVLKELESLLVLAPKEAVIYRLIGQSHEKLGNTSQAMLYYSWAMDLDPRGANTTAAAAASTSAITTAGSNNSFLLPGISISDTDSSDIFRTHLPVPPPPLRPPHSAPLNDPHSLRGSGRDPSTTFSLTPAVGTESSPATIGVALTPPLASEANDPPPLPIVNRYRPRVHRTGPRCTDSTGASHTSIDGTDGTINASGPSVGAVATGLPSVGEVTPIGPVPAFLPGAPHPRRPSPHPHRRHQHQQQPRRPTLDSLVPESIISQPSSSSLQCAAPISLSDSITHSGLMEVPMLELTSTVSTVIASPTSLTSTPAPEVADSSLWRAPNPAAGPVTSSLINNRFRMTPIVSSEQTPMTTCRFQPSGIDTRRHSPQRTSGTTAMTLTLNDEVIESGNAMAADRPVADAATTVTSSEDTRETGVEVPLNRRLVTCSNGPVEECANLSSEEEQYEIDDLVFEDVEIWRSHNSHGLHEVVVEGGPRRQLHDFECTVDNEMHSAGGSLIETTSFHESTNVCPADGDEDDRVNVDVCNSKPRNFSGGGVIDSSEIPASSQQDFETNSNGRKLTTIGSDILQSHHGTLLLNDPGLDNQRGLALILHPQPSSSLSVISTNSLISDIPRNSDGDCDEGQNNLSVDPGVPTDRFSALSRLQMQEVSDGFSFTNLSRVCSTCPEEPMPSGTDQQGRHLTDSTTTFTASESIAPVLPNDHEPMVQDSEGQCFASTTGHFASGTLGLRPTNSNPVDLFGSITSSSHVISSPRVCTANSSFVHTSQPDSAISMAIDPALSSASLPLHVPSMTHTSLPSYPTHFPRLNSSDLDSVSWLTTSVNPDSIGSLSQYPSPDVCQERIGDL